MPDDMKGKQMCLNENKLSFQYWDHLQGSVGRCAAGATVWNETTRL